MCLVCVVSCEKFLYPGAWMPFALGSDCPARPRQPLRALTGVRAVWAPMSHSRAMGLLVSIWSGVRRAAAGGAEARVAAKTAGAGAGAPTAAEWDDRAEHDITILLFWCLVLMDIYGVMHWPAPSRASAAVSTSSSWPRMLFIRR